MYGKSKSTGIPSEAQSKEKLAVYVYEYLMHIGAPKAAALFLQEIRWDKSISLGEPPGFLHSWWNVFWDLYSAAPERRDTHEHSSEAKAFHDYGFVNSGYPNGLPHPNHPVMSGPGGVGGPSGGGPGMPPPLGPPGPDPVTMRQRPSGPPMMPGGGLPPNAGPGLQGPSPHHSSMRFHQSNAGGYPGPTVGGMLPHANLIPGGGPIHPMHSGPMLPHHHHPAAMISHPRPRWMGPSIPQQQQQQSSGPLPPPPSQGGVGPTVCSGSAGPNSVSSTGPGSVGPGSCGGGGIVQSPSHPGTPNQHASQQHLAAPSPMSNQSNCPTEHQSAGSGIPPGHPHHPTPPHYVVGQPPPQQQTPPTSSSCLPPEYNTRPSPHLVFSSGGPGSTPESSMFASGPNSGDSNVPNGNAGGLPPRSTGMMPPPPPEYSGGMPPVSANYPSSGQDLKASPIHSGLSSEMISSSVGGPPPLMPSDYPGGAGPPGNGNGPPGFGGNTPETVMMMPPPPHQQSAVMQQQSAPQHIGSVGGSQGQPAPPPPQYVTSGSGQHSNFGGPPIQSICGDSNPSPVAGGPGSVQFPQEYSFSQLS